MNGVLFATLTLFWGLSFIAIRVTLEAIPPFAGATLRVFIAAVFLISLAFLRRTPRPRFLEDWKKYLYVSMFNFAIPWACLFWGQQFVFPGIASILNATVPIFVFLLSWKFLSDEQPTPLKLIGTVLGFGGIFFMFWPALTKVDGIHLDQLKGMLAIVVMAASYAMGMVRTKQWLRGVPLRWNVSYQCLMASLVLGVLSLATEGTAWLFELGDHPGSILAISYLAVFSTALAWLIYGHLIFTWGAFRTSAVTYLIPLVAIIVDFVWLKSLPNLYEWVGTVLIFSSLALVHLTKRKRVEPVVVEEKSAA